VDLIRTTSWNEFGQILRDRPVRIVVVDPCAIQGTDEAEVLSLLERHSDLLMIAYTQLTIASAHMIVLLAQQREIYEVVLHEYDDSATRFRHLLCSIVNQLAAQRHM
jgi:hypothetical protein